MNTSDEPQPEEERVTAPEAPAAGTSPSSEPSRKSRFGAAKMAAILIAALLVGGGLAFVVEHQSGSSNASASNGPPAFGAGNGFRGGGGPAAGAQRVEGTVTATSTTTVTVDSSSGTATYMVDNSSRIVRDGQQATLAAVQVGDPVHLIVSPSSGQTLVRLLFAGNSAGGPGPGGFGQPGPGGAGSGGSSGA